MSDIKKMQEDVYLKVIPLKGNPLKSINIYVVKSNDRAMIIDTGFNTPEIISHMKSYISDLNLDLSKTILLLTHLHSDHCGLATWFDENTDVDIYMSRIDYEMMTNMREKDSPWWQRIMDMTELEGLKKDNLKLCEHPGYKYRPTKSFDYNPLDPGDIINVGDFEFEVEDFSGHTPGMIGLYDKNKKICFCADHILGSITPNIQFWSYEIGDSLGTYLKNLEKVRSLDIDNLYSSHREIIEDVDKRIDELKSHHKKRVLEVLNALDKYGECSVRDVCENMSWDIDTKDFNKFPNSQKFFAAGEAHAHLEYLRTRNMVDYKKNDDNVLIYYKVGAKDE